ncbi:MAG TPA: hypothetical protein VGB91_11110 [Rhizomicrobium sp.]
MTTFDILQRLFLALAIGLLIGVERGWQERAGQEGSRAALLNAPAGGYLLGLAFAACLALFEWRQARAAASNSATGTIAGLVTFALGAYAPSGNQALAGAAAWAAFD